MLGHSGNSMTGRLKRLQSLGDGGCGHSVRSRKCGRGQCIGNIVRSKGLNQFNRTEFECGVSAILDECTIHE